MFTFDTCFRTIQTMAEAGDSKNRPSGVTDTAQAPTVIPSQDTLIANLLSLDLSVPTTGVSTHGNTVYLNVKA